MIDDRTITPYARDLFYVTDHVLHAVADKGRAGWHVDWAQYHYKRFLGTRAAYLYELEEAGNLPDEDFRAHFWPAYDKIEEALEGSLCVPQSTTPPGLVHEDAAPLLSALWHILSIRSGSAEHHRTRAREEYERFLSKRSDYIMRNAGVIEADGYKLASRDRESEEATILAIFRMIRDFE